MILNYLMARLEKVCSNDVETSYRTGILFFYNMFFPFNSSSLHWQLIPLFRVNNFLQPIIMKKKQNKTTKTKKKLTNMYTTLKENEVFSKKSKICNFTRQKPQKSLCIMF